MKRHTVYDILGVIFFLIGSCGYFFINWRMFIFALIGVYFIVLGEKNNPKLSSSVQNASLEVKDGE